MNKRDKMLQKLLITLATIPICSTDLLARHFTGLKYPSKEASRCLKLLEEKGFVEGYVRRVGETKLWRLTRKGKNTLGVERRSVPFTVRNIEHTLKTGDCYFDLKESGKLKFFQYEPRETFTDRSGRERVYCPDAFFLWDRRPFILEVQRSYLSKTNWREKWKTALDFFGGGHQASSQFSEYMTDLPSIPIIVLTDQEDRTVCGSVPLPIYVHRNLDDWRTPSPFEQTPQKNSG